MLLFYLCIPLMLVGVAIAVGPLLHAMRRGDAWAEAARIATLEAGRFRAGTPPTAVPVPAADTADDGGARVLVGAGAPR